MSIFNIFKSRKQKDSTQQRQFKQGELFLKVRDIAAKQLGITDKESIRPESSFAADLKIDSLDSIELVIALEEAFNIEILDQDIDRMNVVGDIVDYLEKRV